MPAFKVWHFDRVKGTPPDLTIDERASILNCISIITQHYNSKQNQSRVYYQIKARRVNGLLFAQAFYSYSKHDTQWTFLSPNDYLNHGSLAYDLIKARVFKALASVG